MITRLIAYALAFAAAGALAAPADAPSHRFEGRDLFSLQYASDPQIRPDAREVAYVRISFDIMSDRPRRAIWLIDPATGAQTPLSTGAGSSYSPRWSPDGRRLAFLSARWDMPVASPRCSRATFGLSSSPRYRGSSCFRRRRRPVVSTAHVRSSR